MGNTYTLSALMGQLALACNVSAFYLMLSVDHGLTWTYPVLLTLFAPLLYGSDRLLLRRPRNMLTLVLLNGGSCLAVTGLCVWWGGWVGWAELAFMALFLLWVSVKAGVLAVHPPELRSVLLTFDAAALTLLFSVSYAAVSGLERIRTAPALCAFACAALGVAARRTTRRLSAKEYGFIGFGFIGIFLVTWLLTGVLADPAGRGLAALWNGFASLVSTVGRWIGALVLWLLSLLPEGEGYMESAPLPQGSPLEEQLTQPETNPVLEALLSILLLVILFAALWALVKQLRSWKLRISAPEGGPLTARRERPSLWRSLGRWLEGLRKKLRQSRWLRRNRNTPVGLYFILERRCRPVPWHKRPHETPRAFLLRLHSRVGGESELAGALEELADLVDRCFYGGAKNLPYPHGAMIRRRIWAAVAAQTLRQTYSSLKAGLQRLLQSPKKEK